MRGLFIAVADSDSNLNKVSDYELEKIIPYFYANYLKEL